MDNVDEKLISIVVCAQREVKPLDNKTTGRKETAASSDAAVFDVSVGPAD